MISTVKGDAAGVSLYISIFVVDIKLRISKALVVKEMSMKRLNIGE
jgi:hypothetical protein